MAFAGSKGLAILPKVTILFIFSSIKIFSLSLVYAYLKLLLNKGQQIQLTLIPSEANSPDALFVTASIPAFAIQEENNTCIGLAPYKNDTFTTPPFGLKNFDKFLINKKTLLRLIFIE